MAIRSRRVRHVQRERPCRFSEDAPGRGEPRRLGPGPVARRGFDRLSDAFDRIRPECGRSLVPVRRIAHGAETDRHRLHRRGRVSRRALPVNFLPFARPTIDEAMIAAVADTLRSRWIVTGPRVAAFEKALSERFGGRPVRALTSATAAMQVALELLGIGPGDEVIIPAQSFFATGNVVERSGATAVFVDVTLGSRNRDFAQAAAPVPPRPRRLLA